MNAVTYTVVDRTEVESEQAWRSQLIARIGVPHLILRTIWAYGAYGCNYLLTMLWIACELDEIRPVHDQVGAPT